MIFLSLFLPLAAFAIEGEFVQPCRGGAERSEIFQRDSVIYVEKSFEDLLCDQPSLTLRNYGSFALGSPVVEPVGAREIDFRFAKITVTLHQEDATRYYREQKMCGIEEWQVGQEIEVTGKVCEFFGKNSPVKVPSEGDERFGIIGLFEDEIYLGALSRSRDGMQPDRRPQLFDPLPYRRKP